MTTHSARREHHNRSICRLQQEEEITPRTLSFKIHGGSRYAHTAMETYRITMASLQPDSRKLPNCACNVMKKNKFNPSDKVILIAEHNLEEHILCVLDPNKVHQCKLNFMVESGEQVAFRTVGDIPIQLNGFYSKHLNR